LISYTALGKMLETCLSRAGPGRCWK